MNPIFSFKGFSLISIIVLLLFLGVSAAITSSMLGTGGMGNAHKVEAAQALGLAEAGVDWYLEQLEADTDPSTPPPVVETRTFGAGQFVVTPGAATVTRLPFTVEGRVTSPDGLTIKRQMAVTAWKLSPAFHFAVYQGANPGANLVIQNDSTITGDMWSLGSVNIPAGNAVTNGKVYIPLTATVTGAGTYQFDQIDPPNLAMPQIDTAPYTTLMDGYDVTINTAPDAGDCDVTNGETLILSGNIVACAADFNTSGDCTIKGFGTIVAKQDMFLQHNDATGDVLNIDPDPGGQEIIFLARRDLFIGNSAGGGGNNPTVNAGAFCRFYGRNQQGTQTSRLISIRKTNVRLHGAKIYARRRIQITQGATVDQDSLLFVGIPLPASGGVANNLLTISSAGTTIDGALISVGTATVNLSIAGTATTSVTGLVYSSSAGRLELNNCTVTGAVVANMYRAGGTNNVIQQATITYNPTVLLDPPPQGFTKSIMKKPDSWDGM